MRTYFFLLGCIVIVLLIARESLLHGDGALHFYALDVGQGDSLFIVTPSGKQILVDGGPDLSTLSHLSTLMPFTDRTIDLVVLTHSDADHITALPEVLRRYDVETILLSGSLGHSGRVDALLAALQAADTQVLIANPAEDLVLGDGVVLDVVWPTPEAVSQSTLSKNNLSVVVRVLYKEHQILLTGDIEKRAEDAILATGAEVRADVLKVAHHGSKTSTSTGFLLAVQPELAIISVGKDNQYGHPSAQVIDRLRYFDIPIKTTAELGVVSLSFQ